jgi:hypothetical protein
MHFGYQQRSRDIELETPEQRLRLGLARSATEPLPSASATPSERPARSLYGRVVDERGKPVPRAQVGSSSSAEPVFIEANDEGRFEFSNLGADRLNLFATAPGFASTQLPQVAAGSPDVVIVMRDPASLRGTVVFDSRIEKLFVRLCHPDPVHDKELCIKSEYSKPPNSTYELDRLPPGAFDLVFSDGERELGRLPIKIGSGEQLVVPTQRL